MNILYIFFRHRFQPHALPNTGTGRIPHAAALSTLLAPWVTRVKVIDCPDTQLVLILAQCLGDINREGKIAIVMPTQFPVIDYNSAGTHNGTEMEQHAHPVPCFRNRKESVVF